MIACVLISHSQCKVYYACFQPLHQFRERDGWFWFNFGHSLQEAKEESTEIHRGAGRNDTDCRLMGISGLRAVLYKGCWHQRSIITVFYVGLDEFKQPAEVLAAMYTVQANLPNKSCVSHWLHLTFGHQVFSVAQTNNTSWGMLASSHSCSLEVVLSCELRLANEKVRSVVCQCACICTNAQSAEKHSTAQALQIPG